MQAKTYLINMRILSSKMRLKRQQLEESRELATSIKGTKIDDSRVQSSGGNEGFAKIMDDLMDKERAYWKEYREYIKIREEAMSYVMLLDSELHIDILNLKYFQDYSWSEIIRILNYSKSHILREHKKALKELDKKMRLNETK